MRQKGIIDYLTVADLQNRDIQNQDSDKVYIQSLNAFYDWISGDTTTPDDINVIEQVGAVGRWMQVKQNIIPEQRLCLNTATPAFAPLDVNNPTTAEVEAYVTANGISTDGTQVVYFVDGSCDEPDFIWTVNGVDVTLSYRNVANAVTGTGTATRVAFWSGTDTLSSDANLYWDDANNRLGIGTTTPANKLDVNGDVLINGLTIGRGKDNVISNVATGVDALKSITYLYDDPTEYGAFNTANGFNALKNATFSTGCTAVGAKALENATDFSNSCTAVGAYALNLFSYDGINGYANTAFGAGALAYVISPSNLVAIGASSGGWTDIIGEGSIFIGAVSRPLNVNSSDEIVIGYNQVGKGSNTATIGNSNVNVLYLAGAVGWFQGNGTPEGVVTAPVGSFYSRKNGGANTTFYVKESGTGNTGWVAK